MGACPTSAGCTKAKQPDQVHDAGRGSKISSRGAGKGVEDGGDDAAWAVPTS